VSPLRLKAKLFQIMQSVRGINRDWISNRRRSGADNLIECARTVCLLTEIGLSGDKASDQRSNLCSSGKVCSLKRHGPCPESVACTSVNCRKSGNNIVCQSGLHDQALF